MNIVELRKICCYLTFIGLVFVACKVEPEPNSKLLFKYVNYREGPYVYRQKDNYQIIHFDRINQRWTANSIIQPLSQDSIWVGNPSGKPFLVQLKTEADPVYQYTFPGCDKMLVVSDNEGNFEALYHLLRNNGVMDENFQWTFGNGHLVLLGDLFDRGKDVTPNLWLLYKLEQEATSSGGHVHILLGNHEIMIFNGDTRYIHSKYAKQSEESGTPYSSLFNPQSVLGNWLRGKPAIILIKDILLTHAGISPQIFTQKWSLTKMNELVQEKLAGVLDLEQPQVDLLFGSHGIFWYRDWVDQPPPETTLDSILQFYQANHMIIGHTIVPEITAKFQQKLIQVDLHQPRSLEHGYVKSLAYEKGKFFEVNHIGQKKPIKKD